MTVVFRIRNDLFRLWGDETFEIRDWNKLLVETFLLVEIKTLALAPTCFY
jgi:hypothetical protein